MQKSSAVYRRLRRHLDTLPVGFPGTPTGSGLKLLRRLFTPEQAALALAMDHRLRTAEDISARFSTLPAGRSGAGFAGPDRLVGPGATREAEVLLDAMAAAGSVLKRSAVQPPLYSLVPYIVGMFELQLGRVSEGLLKESGRFIYEGYAAEFLSGGTRQTRIIPVEESIPVEHKVATYDELEALIRNADGHIAVADCICRTARDLSGGSCSYTSRRELCLAFRDFADTAVREGWGRALSTGEALEIARENAREGLVLQPSNEKDPQFICSCCSDCCGLLAFAKVMPKPGEFMKGSYRAALDTALCIGCGKCLSRCHMDAFSLSVSRPGRKEKEMEKIRRFAVLDPGRCIGCGVCVPACPAGALSLQPRPGRGEPPQDTEELMDTLLATRRKGLRKAAFVAVVLGQLVFRRIIRLARKLRSSGRSSG